MKVYVLFDRQEFLGVFSDLDLAREGIAGSWKRVVTQGDMLGWVHEQADADGHWDGPLLILEVDLRYSDRDPLVRFAMALLEGDPVAVDVVQDVWRRGK